LLKIAFTYAKLFKYISGAAALIPSIMKRKPLNALNLGWFMEGIMVTIKAAVQLEVIRPKNIFLTQKTG
jgi:hypothetical protein